MTKKLIVTIVVVMAIVGLVVSACPQEAIEPPGPEPDPEPTPDPVEPEPEPPAPARTTGPFLDEVVINAEPSAEAAIQELKNDALDVYAYALADASLYVEVLADPSLRALDSLRQVSQTTTLVRQLGPELTFNPVGPVFASTGKLNPFAVPEFREAMHWLVDRDHVVGDIMGGLGVPMYSCLTPHFAESRDRYSDLMAAMEAQYAHHPARAGLTISVEMQKLGAVFEGGRWTYGGQPVELIFLLRSEETAKEQRSLGEYLAMLLEDLGFEVTRKYGTHGELLPLWCWNDPSDGLFHVYAGAWFTSLISRDEGWRFGAYYTNLGAGLGRLWETYANDPLFYEAAEKLWHSDYTNTEQRRDLFQVCLSHSMKENQRMFLVTATSFTPMRANVRVAHDFLGGVSGSWMWASTAHFADEAGEPVVGETLRMAMPDLLTGPWNPVGGSSWIWDAFAIRATGDTGTQPDTRTALRWPARIEKAEVFVQSGLPVGVTNTEWCTLSFVSEIHAPLDAWADWNAVQQRFITVAERSPGGATALTKSVSYYPKDIFDMPLHDGSTLSLGDFILYTILMFDRGKPDSAIYDEGAAYAYDSFMSTFRGVKFITDNPDYGLIVEYYSDQWNLDAELTVTTMFPFYSHGPGLWHTIALGIRAEEDQALAFSHAKSDALGAEWMSFIDGLSLPILENYLEDAKAANYIPYEPTMGLYVTVAEAADRWSNLETWYSDRGHFWVGSGPFYLESTDAIEKKIHLKRFEDYPDPSDKWLFLLQPLD